MGDDRATVMTSCAQTFSDLTGNERWSIVETSGDADVSKPQQAPAQLSAPTSGIVEAEGKSYEYDSLDDGQHDIRLMTILPGRFEESISCCLATACLGEASAFEALSYSWGDPKVKSTIRVNGKYLDVTSNLAIALRYLRFEKVPRVMWVDATCVNQSDLSERSEQVLHMAEIYSTARDVIVWLGESTESTDKLFPLMDVVLGIGTRALATAREHDGETSLRRHYQLLEDGLWYIQESALEGLGQLASGTNLGKALFWKRDRVLYQHQWKYQARKRIRQSSDATPQHGYPMPMDLDNEAKQAVTELFSRPWWSRMWVIQEFILAKDCTLMCGKHRMPWEEFHRFMSWEYPSDEGRTLHLGRTVALLGLDLHQLRKIMDPYWTGDQSLLDSSPKTKQPSTRGSLSISELMLQFESYQASDPRDKIYALLNLAIDGGCVVPDYNASIENVYTQLVQGLVSKTRDLDIICKHHRGRRSLRLPTWVPDWSIERVSPFQWSTTRGTNLQSIEEVRTARKTYNACQSLPAEFNFIEPDRLLVRGIQCHTVGHIIGLDCSGVLNWHMDCFRRIVEIRFQLGSNPWTMMAEDVVMGFWRTLLHDIWWTTSKRTTPSDRTILSAQLFEHKINGKINTNKDIAYTGPASEVIEHVSRINQQYKLMVSVNGAIGLVPLATQVDDLICVILGAQVPLVLRRREASGTQYELIEPAYVHGLMDGEALRLAKKIGLLRVSLEWFNII